MSWKPPTKYTVTGIVYVHGRATSTTETAKGYADAIEKREAMRKRGYALVWLSEVR